MGVFEKGTIKPNLPEKPIDTVLPIKPQGKVLGIDVSHYEPPLDWKKAFGGGVRWMYTKASEGLSHKDILLHKHCDDAKAAGVYTGAYHFFHASQPGEPQAEHYLKTVEGMKFDLPHCLDWESRALTGWRSVQGRKSKGMA
ncbi:lysozyme [Azospirillaceae bacterium]